MATPKQTDPQFKLRMTPEIKEAIEQSATANNRSMNAEILARLEASFGMDVPLVRGTVSTIQSVQQMAAQLGAALKYLENDPAFRRAFDKMSEDHTHLKEITASSGDLEQDKTARKIYENVMIGVESGALAERPPGNRDVEETNNKKRLGIALRSRSTPAKD